MKHVKPASRVLSVPARASLLETEQKVAVFGAFAIALDNFGESIGTLLGLVERNDS